MNNCKDINLILDGTSCVDECPKERLFVIEESTERKCVDKCDDNKFTSIDSSKSECVDSCNSINKFIDGKTCVNSCPTLKKYKIINI